MITYRKLIKRVEAHELGVEIITMGILEFDKENYHLLRERGGQSYHLLYILDGTGYLYKEKIAHKARAGSAILYYPGQKHEYGYSADEKTTVFFCHFSGNGVEKFLNEQPICSEKVIRSARFDACHNIINRLTEDNSAPSAKALGILSLLYEIYLSEKEEHTADPIDRMISEIHDNYTCDTSIDEWAQKCFCSKHHFLRCFKAKTGTSPIAYRNEYRLMIAEQLLSETDLSLDKIAEAVGFCSASYFSRLYKKSRGRSPKAKIDT